MEDEPPKAEPPKRKRRWFQFSLRTLMIAVTLVAVPLGWIGCQVRIVAERKAVKAMLEKRNLGMGGLPNWVPLDQWPHLPWYRESGPLIFSQRETCAGASVASLGPPTNDLC